MMGWHKMCCTQGYQASRVARMTRRETHEALASWLPGRTAEGVKQAINAHILGHEHTMLMKLRCMHCWRLLFRSSDTSNIHADTDRHAWLLPRVWWCNCRALKLPALLPDLLQLWPDLSQLPVGVV